MSVPPENCRPRIDGGERQALAGISRGSFRYLINRNRGEEDDTRH
jgi:hypothetical protein